MRDAPNVPTSTHFTLWARRPRIIFGLPMFGIGGGELVVILIVTLLAVGPDRMPALLKAVGRGIREMRKATRELQSTVGLDEILRDDTFRDPLGLSSKPEPKPAMTKLDEKPAAKPASRRSALALTDEELLCESPADGVDVAYAEGRLARKPSEEPVS